MGQDARRAFAALIVEARDVWWDLLKTLTKIRGVLARLEHLVSHLARNTVAGRSGPGQTAYAFA